MRRLGALLILLLTGGLRADGSAERYVQGVQAYEAKHPVQAAALLRGVPDDANMPEQARAYAGILLSRLALADGDTQTARVQAEALVPLLEKLDAKAQVDLLLHLSYVRRNIHPHDFEGSVSAAKRAAELEPRSMLARFNLARSYLKLAWNAQYHRKPEALRAALQEAETWADKVEAAGDVQMESDLLNLRGQVAFMRSEFPLAIQLFKASRAKAPRSADHRNLGWSYLLWANGLKDCGPRLYGLHQALALFTEAAKAGDTNGATEGALRKLPPEIERLEATCKELARDPLP